MKDCPNCSGMHIPIEPKSYIEDGYQKAIKDVAKFFDEIGTPIADQCAELIRNRFLK